MTMENKIRVETLALGPGDRPVVIAVEWLTAEEKQARDRLRAENEQWRSEMHAKTVAEQDAWCAKLAAEREQSAKKAKREADPLAAAYIQQRRQESENALRSYLAHELYHAEDARRGAESLAYDEPTNPAYRRAARAAARRCRVLESDLKGRR